MSRRRRRTTLAALLAATLTTAAALAPPVARAQTSYPMVSRLDPVAVRRGTTVETTFSSTGSTGGVGEITGAFAVLAEAPGLSGEVLPADGPASAPPRDESKGGRRGRLSQVKARLTAAADAPLGPREVRLATPRGVSSVGLVVVVDDPVVAEADDVKDDNAPGAQPLELPCVVSGSVGKVEDVDWYAVPARAGQRLTFSVWANRLQNKIHDLQLHFDPILQLFDASGRELAADDNHDFADPLLSYEFAKDGTYYLQVRDTAYGGNANWAYALHATAGPVPTSVFPLAVNPGKTAELHAGGPNVDPGEAIALAVPAALAAGVQLVSLPTARGPSLAVPVVVTDLPVVAETGDAPADAASAQAVTLPAAVGGRLGAANDGDSYRFDAAKGRVYAFEVVARRAGTATDPVLKVVDLKGATLAEADDTAGLGKDCRLEWTAPADGAYAVVVGDLHSRGGEEFGYALLAAPARPDFTLTCDPDKLNVGPGGRVPLFVQVTRRAGFEGAVAVDLGGLPAGVSASPLTLGPKMTQGVTVVSADAALKPSATFLTLQGKAETPDGALARAAAPKQEIYMPGGGRGNFPVNTLALGVTETSDIAVEATPRSITLAPGGTATIEVTVTRKEGFDKGVNLAVVLQHLNGVLANPLPPGVTVREAGSKTLLGPREVKGKIVLQAAATAAPIESVPVCVMGHVSINFVVKTAYASAPIGVAVTGK